MIPVTVTFYGDVGFDRSYNHVIDFYNENQRENYFNPRILKSIQDCAYNKPMNSIQIKCPYEEALNFTYCKFIIGSSSNSRKIIYAWVDDVVLITDQKDETNNFIPILQINISIDPWQTFLFNFTLGESFVVREHVDRFKSNGDGTFGWCLPNTSDVNNIGIDIREDILATFKKKYTFTPSYYDRDGKIHWFIIQYVQRIGQSSRNQMVIRYLPVSDSPINMTFKTTVGGETQYYELISMGDILSDEYISKLGLDPQTIASVSYIPFDVLDFDVDDIYLTVKDEGWAYAHSEYEGSLYKYLICYKTIPRTETSIELEREYNLLPIDFTLPRNNDNYNPNSEPQLFKQPFFRVSYINEFNNEVSNLPECCINTEDKFNKIKFILRIDGVDVKLRIIPVIDIDVNNQYFIEYSLSKVEVLRNEWLSYLLQERETDRQMISSQINQQAIASAIGGVSSATGMGGQQAMSVGKAGVGQSELGGFAAGAIVGLGVGAIQTVGGYVANKHFAFEQQDIREKAIRRKANNIMQAGGYKSNLGECKIVVIKCDATTHDIKANEFHKYGYSVFFYETPNLKSRKYFNFIATNLVKIEGSLNNNVKMALAEIFNNGVTIWHGDYINELSGIGDYSKENIERSLL